MTNVLIVDDDLNQLRLLARVISVRGKDMTVTTAASGREAIERLERSAIDLVLTDLQMPDVNGFELLAWLVTNQPHVVVFTMTAYPDEESISRLRDLGSIECFTKPLDVRAMLSRLSSTLEGTVRGHVRNISLASLLQLIEMERKTCTLVVDSANRQGTLFLREGRLIDARTGGTYGTQAAITIAGWLSPAITISADCRATRDTVDRPLGYIIMEAMRLLDEEQRQIADAAALPTPPPLPMTERPGPISLSHFPPGQTHDADLIMIVEQATGRVRTSVGTNDAVDSLALLAANVYRAEVAAIARLALDDQLEEVTITTPTQWILVRPVPTEQASLAVLVFDPRRSNVVMQRLELDRFLDAVHAWRRAAKV
jgi:CheY-like chemotaxis protein